MPFPHTKPLTPSSEERLRRAIITQEGPPEKCRFSKAVLEMLDEFPDDPGTQSLILTKLRFLRDDNEFFFGVPWASAAEE